MLEAGLSEEYANKIIQFYFDSVDIYTDERPVLTHGDMTPYNVMISDKNEVYIVDFGMVTGGLKYFDLARWDLMGLSYKQLREMYKEVSNISDSNFERKCDVAKLKHHLIMLGFTYNQLRNVPNKQIEKYKVNLDEIERVLDDLNFIK